VNEEFEPGTGGSAGFSDDPGAEKFDEQAMIEEGRAAAILAYIPFLCFVPLIKMKENPFALHHGKQGLLLFIVEVVAVFFMFDVISDLFWGLVLILAAGTAVVGILYSLQGKEFTIPFLGKLADKLKI
jgi:uncharacterized membrane protein